MPTKHLIRPIVPSQFLLQFLRVLLGDRQVFDGWSLPASPVTAGCERVGLGKDGSLFKGLSGIEPRPEDLVTTISPAIELRDQVRASPGQLFRQHAQSVVVSQRVDFMQHNLHFMALRIGNRFPKSHDGFNLVEGQIVPRDLQSLVVIDEQLAQEFIGKFFEQADWIESSGHQNQGSRKTFGEHLHAGR